MTVIDNLTPQDPTYDRRHRTTVSPTESITTRVRSSAARLTTTLTVALIHALAWVGAAAATLVGPSDVDEPPRRLRGQRGQATTEYALVLLAAALVALLVVAWATAGGGAGKISRLFNRVIDAVTGKI